MSIEHHKNEIIVVPICFECKHFKEDSSYTCTAFPNGIADEILTGEQNHITPISTQANKIVFEQKG